MMPLPAFWRSIQLAPQDPHATTLEEADAVSVLLVCAVQGMSLAADVAGAIKRDYGIVK